MSYTCICTFSCSPNNRHHQCEHKYFFFIGVHFNFMNIEIIINVGLCSYVNIFIYIFIYFQNVGEKVTKQLMENDDVLNYVFTLLAHQKTFINSCQLIEDLLQSSREVLDLHRIRKSSIILFLAGVLILLFQCVYPIKLFFRLYINCHSLIITHF